MSGIKVQPPETSCVIKTLDHFRGLFSNMLLSSLDKPAHMFVDQPKIVMVQKLEKVKRFGSPFIHRHSSNTVLVLISYNTFAGISMLKLGICPACREILSLFSKTLLSKSCLNNSLIVVSIFQHNPPQFSPQ